MHERIRFKGKHMTQAKTLQATSDVRFNRFLALVYLVMAVGMAITALVATSVSTNEELMKRILFDPWFTFGLFMLQIIVVVWLSAAVMRMSAGCGFPVVPVLFSPDRPGTLIDLHLLQPEHHRLYLLGGCRDVLIQQYRRLFYQG